MPSVSQTDSRPSSPRSPPRKRTKFSLKLKSKKKALSESENRENLFPIFSPPNVQNASDDEAFEPPIPPPPYAGLKNLGNICYANAVLQVLRYCPGLEQSVIEIDSLVRKLRLTRTTGDEQGPDKETDPCSNTIDDHRAVVCKLKELFSKMKDLELDYGENKENCDHLVPRKNCLVLAAQPVDFMETFRKQNPVFEDYQQHDAQEFLCSLLVNLKETENDIKQKDEKTASIINSSCPFKKSPRNIKKSKHLCPLEELFLGRLLHQTKCMTCEEAKKRFENFQDISVPVQQEPKVYDAKNAHTFSPTPKKGQDSRSLPWALSQFARVEHLTGDNKYFCDNCLTHTEAEISTCFDKLPRILTIHLKRFTTSALSGFLSSISKITSNLDTPMELSVKEWCSKSCPLSNPTYHLFGIVMHSGMTSCSGHYQAYVKVPRQAQHDNTQVLSSDSGSSVDSDKAFPEENSSHSFLSLDDKSVGSNTFSRDTKPSDHNQISSPQSSAEKVKTTCITGITKYFHKSKKHSKTETTTENIDEGIDQDKTYHGEKQRHYSTPTFTSTRNEKSVTKIHSFQYKGGTKSSRSAIRQLNFQENNIQLDKRCQGARASVPTTETSHPCKDVSVTQSFHWIHFDDAEVGILDESDVKTLLSSSESCFTSPYLLFYKLAEP